MNETCSFHPAETAHFQCHECNTTFCDACVDIRDTVEFTGKNRYYFCPACNVPLQMLSVGSMIEPFWHRLSAFFLYPFQLTPLLLALILSILGAAFPTSFFVNIFIWIVTVKYAYAALTATAQGGLKAPAVTWALINQNVLQVFKQYVVFIIIGLLAMLVFAKTGVFGGVVFLVFIALAMPAIIMLLVATDSILHALNPTLFIPVITRIGWPYLLMYLFLVFLLSGPATLFSYLPADALPMQLRVFLALFCKQFYTLISYHLMGYVLLQFHNEIGYQVDYDFFMENRGGKKKRKPLSPVDELKNGLAVLLKMGRYQEAIQRLTPHIQSENPDPGLSDKFLQLLKMTGEQENASRYALRHFDLLVRSKKKRETLELFPEIEKADSGSPSPESVFTAASWYQERNDFKKATAAYVYFLKQFKDHPLRPETYFNLARLLHERGNNSGKAKQILAAIVKHYPQHDLCGEARNYLALIT
jgi:hypothetical protein